MDASTEPDRADVVVAGAGLAGLAAASVAAGAGARRVVLVDGRNDERAIGGRARTDHQAGFALNQGPRALFRGGAGRPVLERLGLRPTGGPPATSCSYGLRDGHLERLPDDGRALLTSRLLGIRSKAQVGWLLARIADRTTEGLADRSTAEWIASLGLRPDAVGLVTMLTRVATYTEDLTRLSADAGARQVQMALVDGVDYLDGGWQQLVDGLVGVARSRGVEIRTGSRLAGVGRAGDGDGWVVTTAAGSIRAARVVLALGSPRATAAVLDDPPAWEAGHDATAACLDLGLRRAPGRAIVFGIDEPLYLSTHTPSARLAPEGGAVVHVLRYGAGSAEADRAQLWALAARAGVDRADVVVERFLHRMVVAHSLPRPGAGLAGRPPVAVAGHPSVYVAGDWVGPEGLLADASLASAEVAGRLAADPATDPATHLVATVR